MTEREGRPALPGETAPSQVGDPPQHERHRQRTEPQPSAEPQPLPLPVAPALRRRWAGAVRCEPLDDTGRRDPMEPPPDPPPTPADLDRWAMALLHLRRCGLAGLPPADVRRALAADRARYADVLPRATA